MKTVHTKEALAAALKAGETHILVEGEIAEVLKRRNKHKKGAVIGAGCALLGIAAAPFTGGSSAVAGLALGLSISAFSISAGELMRFLSEPNSHALGLAGRNIKLKPTRTGGLELFVE